MVDESTSPSWARNFGEKWRSEVLTDTKGNHNGLWIGRIPLGFNCSC